MDIDLNICPLQNQPYVALQIYGFNQNQEHRIRKKYILSSKLFLLIKCVILNCDLKTFHGAIHDVSIKEITLIYHIEFYAEKHF